MKLTSLKKNIIHLVWIAPLTLVSFYSWDGPLALYIKRALMQKHTLLASNVPDVLFGFVCLLTALAVCVYVCDTRRGVYTVQTRFFQIIALSLPIAFLLKSALKYAFGSVNTRVWLRHPDKKEFLWFHGGRNYDGFPSGHMAVFTALLLAVAERYPRWRFVCYASLAGLAAALIITNYHFLSDVIAGAYVGYVVHSAVSRNLPSQDKIGPSVMKFLS